MIFTTSGGPIDVVKIINYIIQQSPDKKMPSTILVEIASPSIKVSNPQQTPLLMLPYLPFDQAVLAAGATADDLIRRTSLSDSIFTLLFVDTHRWHLRITYANDGSGILTHKRLKNATQYQTSVKSDIDLGKYLISCQNDTLDSSGKEYVEKLVELSRIHRFSIVFYRPPINADLYTISKTKPGTYARCRDMFNTYMNTLTGQNPNVFYRDLSNTPKISTLGVKAYLDTHHLNAYGNALVIQALNKEIESALAWSKINQK
jgi:hypothetical protein